MLRYIAALDFSDPYFPVLVLLVISLLTAAGLVALSHLTGPKIYDRIKYSVYECGVDPLGPARIRVSVKFYLVALTFIVFDLEATFLYPWAILFRSLGWYGFLAMCFFLAMLAIGLVYEWKKGALEWQ
jgi:NADH-quinone oxidoreductase subunit A